MSRNLMRSLYNNKPLNNDSKNVIHNESSVDSDIAEIRIINNSSPSKESHSNIKDNSLLGNGKSSKNETTPRLNFSKGKKRKNEIENDIENSLLKKANTNGMDNNGTFMIIEPTTSFDDMGGVDQQKYEALEMCLYLKQGLIFKSIGMSPPKGLILHGPRGTGKTMFAEALAGLLKVPLIKVSCTKIFGGITGKSEENLRNVFKAAENVRSCVLLLDQVEVIASSYSKDKQSQNRLVSQLMQCMDDIGKSTEINFDKNDMEVDDSKNMDLSGVIVVGTTHKIEDIDEGLRRAGRFDKELFFGIPNENGRGEILKKLTRNIKIADAEKILPIISKEIPGYVGADIQSLVREASMISIRRVLKTNFNIGRDDETLLMKTQHVLEMMNYTLSEEQVSNFIIEKIDFDEARKIIQPSAIREGFATVPDVSWEDIGALAKVRDELNWAILYPITRSEIFTSLNIVPKASGILLYGPPGCGKTLVAKAVANQSKLNFISVKGPELINMYVGESERAVRTVFQRARNSAPCVIFFDEIDALAPVRSSKSQSSETRLVNQLLTEMDGIEGRNDVYLIAATNRLDIVDPAILRPGRLDRKVYVGIPSTEEKIDILTKISKYGVKPKVDNWEETFKKVCEIEKVKNFSGADITQLLYQASMLAVRDLQEGKSLFHSITLEHFERALTKMKASVSDHQMKYYLCQEFKHASEL
ncbi:AAA+ ATPase domain and ATPase, AAA-type, core domain and P-loop containing nucleoside triphosphate hydrolase domain-containing protein [Strongyloides ratti]|uniref:AAA+ ATPase domain and ATPase, AAA-type, core domain and P-loop containing nucleoside triphosphate hydrolase domain-containing protein n=1 Tax=Strongyloides ratti TaxID=34506 RepID=A0A090LE28_STRRB|nr:AAA+ ATPase domain and ATPase, AAA-type, core domain and P-loop containing nucleoside triphosphate hydrolase domain-containing protein [Strongyloides ratti]CEF68046.1 AAA+ ATPase domain and ATPase, AAA-type, core domain and P-loop containing nucleoside triphosphate hydrolase domain-containing protein [Strongyloides ratti]